MYFFVQCDFNSVWHYLEGTCGVCYVHFSVSIIIVVFLILLFVL